MFQVNLYEFHDKQLPEAFNNTRIAHISDLHSANYGESQSDLLSAIEDSNPDFIAITGDLIDNHYNKIDIVMNFINGAVKIAPTFFVTGNHEAWTKLYLELEIALKEAGVIILRDEIFEIVKDNEVISIIGLDDPSFSKHEKTSSVFTDIHSVYYNLRANVMGVANVSVSNFNQKYTNNDGYSAYVNASGVANPSIDIVQAEKTPSFRQKLNILANEADSYKIILSHRPEYFKDFVDVDANLVLTGHTHGGQVCLPKIGNIYSPNQGFFPEYSDGLYEKTNTKMIISRGLGNSGVPFRWNNKPELVIITLKN